VLDFDDRTYRIEVLAPVLSGAALPDYFTRYALDPGERDRNAIEARLGEIRAFWDREHARNPKYADTVALLIGEHATAKLVLLDPRERQRAAEKAHKTATEADEAVRKSWEQLDARIQEVLARAKGLSPRDRNILEELARGLGLAPGPVAARLDRVPALKGVVAVEPLAENIRSSIALTLKNYAAATNNPREGISLFHFLGFSKPEYDCAQLTAAIEERGRRNRMLPAHHPAKNLTDRALSLARVHLIESDPERYLAALVVDVQEKLRPRAADLAIDDGAIDDVESEQLINAAQQLGLPTAQARGVVSELAVALGVELRLGAVVDYVSCAGCNRPYRADAAPERCGQCGDALFRSCPRCGERCGAGDVACPHCATDLMSLLRAEQTLREAREALRSGWIAQATASLALLEEDGEQDQAKSLRAELDRALTQARGRWQRVERAMSAQHCFAAMPELKELVRGAHDLPDSNGALPSECLQLVEEQMTKAETLLRESEKTDVRTRELALVRALELVADHRQAQQQLARMKPLPVGEVRMELDGSEGVRVSWLASASPGELRYRVRREVLRGAASSTVLAESEALEVKDHDVDAGAIVRYGVGAERAGGSAETVWGEALLVVCEVQDLTVLEREGEVGLSWRPLQSSARVEVQRLDERSKAVKEIPCDRAGANDRDVENGARYRYCVRVSYLDDQGRLHRTRGLVVFGSPAVKPLPVTDLLVEEDDGSLRLRFTSPAVGTVQVVRCASRPEALSTEELSAEELASLGEPMPSDTRGIHDPHPGGLAWYLPISTSGDCNVAGQPVMSLGLGLITEVRAVDLGSSVKITWRWPRDVHAAIVLWRRDRQPGGAEDDRAERALTTTARYATEGGVEIEVPGEQAVFIAVLPGIRVGEEMLHPSYVDRRSRTVVNRRAQTDIGYSVRRSRLRKRSVAVTITEPCQGPLPDLLVVAKRGELLPRSASDGEVLARLGGSSAIRELPIDVSGLGRPLVLRLFLGSEPSAGSYRIQHPNTDELLLR
jgi:hypothetical protein